MRDALIWAVTTALLLVGCAAAPPPPVKVAALNAEAGAMVDIEAALPRGYVTVVDFWATYCAACKTVEAKLLSEIRNVPDVVVRKVDVGPGDSAVAKAYKIAGLPHLRIFDRRGRLRYMLVGDDAKQAGEFAIALSAEK